MNADEKAIASAAYWKKAQADADPEYWKGILDKAVPMSSGRGKLLYGFTEDQLDQLVYGPPPAKLRSYKLGERVNHPLHCQRCGRPFTSKRASARFCGKPCR